MNKLIVVTGGTKGIGRAILEKFAAMGFDLVTCARKTEELERLKKTFMKNYPQSTVHIMEADLSDKQQVVGFCDFVCNLNRPVDVLVNNAGYFIPGAITTEPDGSLESMINANLYSAYYTTRGLIPVMKEQRAGHVFNMCSIASFTAYSNGGSYAISKFAMLGFSKCLRTELKEFGIRVTAVMPGATKTDSWDGTAEADERFMKAEDVAETIYAAYTLSDRAVMEEVILRPQLGDL
jgi:short-subunit dehydrogenase